MFFYVNVADVNSLYTFVSVIYLEDSSNGEYPRTETIVNGFGHIYEVVRLSTHGAILWGIVHGGRCMDMHGSDGYIT